MRIGCIHSSVCCVDYCNVVTCSKISEMKDSMIRVGASQLGGRRNSGSGVQYQQLARDEQEADQSLGLELGIGGIGGLLNGSGSGKDTQRLLTNCDDDYCDGIV